MRWAIRPGVVLRSFSIAICAICFTMKTDEVPACDNWCNGDILLLGSYIWRGRLLKLLDTQSDSNLAPGDSQNAR